MAQGRCPRQASKRHFHQTPGIQTPSAACLRAVLLTKARLGRYPRCKATHQLMNFFQQMERVYQMNVVPDIIPVMHPSVDLRVVYRTPHNEFLRSLPNEERPLNQRRPNAPDKAEVERDTIADRHWRDYHLGLKRRKVRMQVEPGMYLSARQVSTFTFTLLFTR